MKVDLKVENDTLSLYISETIDSVSAPELEALLKENIGGMKCIILDLKELRYMSSAGLRLLLGLNKQMMGNGTMIVRNVGEAVREILDVTGFTSILNIE